MNFKDLKIGTKLTIGFGLVTAMLVTLGVTQKLTLNTLSRDSHNMYNSADMADHIMEAKADMIKEQQVVMELIAARTANEISEWWNLHLELVDTYDDNIVALIEIADKDDWGQMHADDKSAVIKAANELDNMHNNKIDPLFKKLKDLVDRNLTGTINITELDEHDHDLDEAMNEVIDGLEAIELIVATIVEESELESEKNTEKSSIQLLVLIIVGIVLSISFSVIIVRAITRPLTKAVELTRKITAGDLTATIDIQQTDEVGQLVDYLKQMTEKLKEIVSDIMAGADNIASASGQMSSTSQEMSQGASEQASSVEEVTSTMEEMSANIEQNADNSSQTEKISLNASSGMTDVKDRTNNAVQANKEISEKIKVINDIAFQTNILALNAAVEAARAGEHGRGFAVVAAEVRKLAERSKDAAEEIVSLAQNSFEVTQEAGEKLETMLPEIDKTTKLVQEIAAASNEQKNGAQQVNSAMQQLNNVTQQSAAASEELATSSEELSSQAQQLKDMVAFFNIGGQTGKRHKTVNTKSAKSLVSEPKMVKGNGNTGAKIAMLTSDANDSEFESY